MQWLRTWFYVAVAVAVAVVWFAALTFTVPPSKDSTFEWILVELNE